MPIIYQIINHVKREKVEPTDENFKDYMSQATFDNQYFQTLSMVDYQGVEEEVEFANKILHDYDFIGVTERMDDSLVVLSMLLNLQLTDILYLSAKGNGSFDDAGLKECTYIVPTFISPSMKQYFNDTQWTRRTKGDALLHCAAQRSLDMTIDQLGRDKFNIKIKEYKRMQKLVTDACMEQVAFPCDAGGKRQTTDCYWVDSGCGNRCIDSISF